MSAVSWYPSHGFRTYEAPMDSLALPSSQKRKREPDRPTAGPSGIIAPQPMAVTGSQLQVPSTTSVSESDAKKAKKSWERKPQQYNSCAEMLHALRQCVLQGGSVEFSGSYSVVNEPPISDKYRIQVVAHEIWTATGYRFTVKDHPPMKEGHKTRLWCSQDEARQYKTRDKDRSDVWKSRVSALSGETVGKARYPCRSRLLISSKESSVAGRRLVTMRMHHDVSHEAYSGGWAKPEMSVSSGGSGSVDSPSEDGEDEEGKEPPRAVVFQKRMRTHISTIRDFCDGLEYQLQFNDWDMLHALEREGAGFLKLVRECLEREGRLTEEGEILRPSHS